jgi:hypothetical protein
MSKRQDGPPLSERLAAWGRTITPTREEQAMVAAILLSLLTGAVVQHCRREYRIDHPVQASPTPRHGWESAADR